MKIIISEEFHVICADYLGGIVLADVINAPSSNELQQELHNTCDDVKYTYTPDTLKTSNGGICATRAAYRRAGKDPSRYRPASEQLARRVLQGKELWSVNTLVDLGNIVSLRSGYAVAVLDAERIEGDILTLGIGREGEPYEGIGRGTLNIADMPVFRDAQGGIATPTSDNERTRIEKGTTRVCVLINGYDGNIESVKTALGDTARLLTTYASAQNVVSSLFTFTHPLHITNA